MLNETLQKIVSDSMKDFERFSSFIVDFFKDNPEAVLLFDFNEQEKRDLLTAFEERKEELTERIKSDLQDLKQIFKVPFEFENDNYSTTFLLKLIFDYAFNLKSLSLEMLDHDVVYVKIVMIHNNIKALCGLTLAENLLKGGDKHV